MTPRFERNSRRVIGATTVHVMCAAVALSFPNRQIPGGEKGSAAMHNDLIHYTQSRRPDRALVAQGRDIVGATQLGALKADAAFALGAHVMEGAAGIIAHGRALAGGDPQLGAVMASIAGDTIRQAQTIQRQTFNPFGI
jgi:hypothetical protein